MPMSVVTIMLLIVLSCQYSYAGEQPAEKSVKRKTVYEGRDTNNPSLWVARKIDDMEGDTTYYSTRYVVVSNESKKKGLRISIQRVMSMDLYWVSIYAIGAGSCVDEHSRIIILFEDQTKRDFEGEHDFNCDGRASFSLSQEDIDLYLSKAVSKIRVYTRNGYIEEQLTASQANEYRITLKHLTRASR